MHQKLKIYKPVQGLPTPAVYKALDINRCSKKDPEELLEAFLENKPFFVNDLENPAFQLMPSLKCIKGKLAQISRQKCELGATMSGSGTAFFYF